MKEEKIIEKFVADKDGNKIEIVIRFPKKNDFYKIWKFYNKVIKETSFLSRITPVKRKEENKWFSDMMKKVKRKDMVYFVAEHNGKIIGSVGVERDFHQTHHHVGICGIGILQKYTGLGLGKKLTRLVIELSKKEMKLEIIRLNVYSKNKIAYRLYRKLGFNYVGKIPKGSKRNGNYMDDMIMYKVLK